jgi:DNA replication and repair protein RecF
MRITSVSCNSFRCLKQIDWELHDGISVIRGNNAQGKTSLLECIQYAVTSKSHRTTRDADLIAHGTSGFSIRVTGVRKGQVTVLEAYTHNGAKRFKVNGVPQTRVSDILGKLHVVFFSPEDVRLVQGSASDRRQFMDMELSQIHNDYLIALQQYRLVLRQRNELLRSRKSNLELLHSWTPQLIQHGSHLMEYRARFVEELSGLAAQAYSSISTGEELDIQYSPSVQSAEDYESILEHALDSDIRRQSTSKGPHRDEITITIDGQPARSHASQGQKKSTSLSLKLAELELVHRRIGEYPVLMLDEVLSELDANRSRELFRSIPESVQCLVTTTERNTARLGLTGSWNEFEIEEGRLLMEQVKAINGKE